MTKKENLPPAFSLRTPWERKFWAYSLSATSVAAVGGGFFAAQSDSRIVQALILVGTVWVVVGIAVPIWIRHDRDS